MTHPLDIPSFLKLSAAERAQAWKDESEFLRRMAAQGKQKEIGMPLDESGELRPLSNVPSRSAKGEVDSRFPTINPLSDDPVPAKRKKDKVSAKHVAGKPNAFKVERTPAPSASEEEPKRKKDKAMARTESVQSGVSDTSKLFVFFLKSGMDRKKTQAEGLRMKLAPGTARVRPSQWSQGKGITQANISYAESKGVKVPASLLKGAGSKTTAAKPKTKPKKAKSKRGGNE